MRPKSMRSRAHMAIAVAIVLALGACKPPAEEDRPETKRPQPTEQSAREPVAPGPVVTPPPDPAAPGESPAGETPTEGAAAPGVAERALRPTFLPPQVPQTPPAVAGQSPIIAPPAPRVGQLDLAQAERTFADEFETFDWDEAFYGAGARSGRWRTSYMNGDDPNYRDNRTLPGNGELQAYMDRSFPQVGHGSFGLHPFEIVDGGVLRISANIAAPRVRSRAWGRRYTSGVITSWGSFSQRYGVFQVRARLPKGKGLWPAFWLLNQEGGWPPEIDVLEVLGQEPTKLFTAVHTASSGRHVGTGETTTVADMTENFHVYSVDWGPKQVIFYFEGREVWRHPTPPDLHKPMFLIVNLAVGGHWPGPPNRATVLPAHLDVDWVRVWQRPEYASLPQRP
jgi:beta-glucanase (GH16 family)